MKKNIFKILVLFFLFASGIFASIFFGPSFNYFDDAKNGISEIQKSIILNIRLPRTILCCIAGILLSCGGVLFQMFFANPLAEPGIMGLSAGATLGAVTSCYIPATGIFMISLQNAGAFLGSLAAGILISFLSVSKNKFSSKETLLLCGTVLGTFYSALTTLLLTLNSKNLSRMYFWMTGSFSGRSWAEIKFLVPLFFVCLALIFLCSTALDLFSSGETVAITLGVSSRRFGILVLAAGSLATSISVCAGGTIGFIGFIAPHIARKIFSSKTKVLLPAAACLGSTILLFSDVLCRTILKPQEIPVGIICAFLGVPFFISLMKK